MTQDNCIFCKIANGEIPSRTVYEDEDFRAILDLGPATRRIFWNCRRIPRRRFFPWHKRSRRS